MYREQALTELNELMKSMPEGEMERIIARAERLKARQAANRQPGPGSNYTPRRKRK
jgi:hypothetical protein